MLKKAQVVMLPQTTDKKHFPCIAKVSPFPGIPDEKQDKKLHFVDALLRGPFTYFDLYLTSDDKIKEGDYAINAASSSVFKIGTVNEGGCHATRLKDNQHYYLTKGGDAILIKIVATTNPDLWIKQLPNMGEGMGWRPSDIAKISTDFVEAYVREQGNISEVMLEYEDLSKNIPHNEKFAIREEWLTRLKLRSNGTVIIHPVKPKVYTRDEVRTIVNNYDTSFTQLPAVKWFDENYPE